MRVKAKGWSPRELSLFTPEDMKTDVVMVDAILQVEQGDCAIMVVENHSNFPVQLKNGVTLGIL